MSAHIVEMPKTLRSNPSDELSQQLRNLADSLDGISAGEPNKIASAVILIECESGELVPVHVGVSDWVRTTGLLFAAAQQVSRGEG